jgi:ABC-2 type transport system ATP-binding protein
VFISSHLLDEVEKICDHAAIVDRGKILMQGAIADLAEGGAGHELIIGVNDPVRALEVLDASNLTRQAQRSDEGLRVTLSEIAEMSSTERAAAVNAALVGAGLAVSRLEPVRQSLEKRFLEVTSRLSDSTTTEKQVAA